MWFTLGYRITLQPIQVGRNINDYVGFDYYYSTYSTPNNNNHAVVHGNYITSAIKKELGYVHNTNRVDTIHGLLQSTLRTEYSKLAAQYPHLVYREGNQVYAFLQPIIGVANQEKGGYYAVKISGSNFAKEYRSLGQWKNAKGWANTSINGWGGATSNCWDKGELVRGTEYKSDGYGITGTMKATTERRNEAMNEVSGSHTMTAVASGQPMAMVFIYEEAAEVMVRTYVSSQHERDIDKLYNLYGIKEPEVTLQGKTYKTSM